MNMIEVIDKINNKIYRIDENTEIIIDPDGNTLFMKDYELESKKITGIIHKEDGSTLFCYENVI